MRRLVASLPIVALTLLPAPAHAVPAVAVAAILEGTSIAAATITATAIAITIIVNIGIAILADELLEPRAVASSFGMASTAPIARHRPQPAQRRQQQVMEVAPRSRWWGLWLAPWWPFMIVRTSGTCMEPKLMDHSWIVVDRRARIRSGDLCMIKFDGAEVNAADLAAAGSLWFMKRFVVAEGGNLVFDMLNPPTRMVRPEKMFAVLARVRAISPTFWSAWLLLFAMLWRPGRFQERLAS